MQEGYINHIYYKIIGEGDPLVLISGLAADHQGWLSLAALLGKKFKCILLDNRGIGKSLIPDDGECTIEKMSEDIVMLLKGLGIEKADMVGHSMGGYIAQHFSANNPARINNLILMSTKARSQAVQSLYQKVTIKMMELNIQRELIIQNALCWLFSSKYLSNPQNITNIINAGMQKPQEESRKSYFYQVHAAFNFDTSAYAVKIFSPTLIITGAHDLLATVKDAEYLNQLISHSALDIIENMAHMPHIKIPEAVSKKIIKFLS